MLFKIPSQRYSKLKKYLLTTKSLAIVFLITVCLALSSLFSPNIGQAADRSYAVNNQYGANVKAFLDVIAFAEGTNRENGYSIMFTGIAFSGFNAHPRQINCTSDKLCSDAAGRYQFLSTTWEPIASRLGLRDFSPESQDLGAIELLKESKALEDILAGRIDIAICKVAPVWASFPDCRTGESVYGQPSLSSSKLQASYQSNLAYHQGKPSTVAELPLQPLPGCSVALWGECRDEAVTNQYNSSKQSQPNPVRNICKNEDLLWGTCPEEKR